MRKSVKISNTDKFHNRIVLAHLKRSKCNTGMNRYKPVKLNCLVYFRARSFGTVPSILIPV